MREVEKKDEETKKTKKTNKRKMAKRKLQLAKHRREKK